MARCRKQACELRTVRKPPRSRRLCRGGRGTGSERSRRRDHSNGRAKVSQGVNCVAGAALSQGQVSQGGGWQDAENVGAVRELGFPTMRKQPRLRRLYEAVSERVRNGLGDGTIGTAARRFHEVKTAIEGAEGYTENWPEDTKTRRHASSGRQAKTRRHEDTN